MGDHGTTTIRRRRLTPTRRRQKTLRIVFTPEPEGRGRAYALDGALWTFGRAVEGPAQIDDPRMSRTHARVLPGPDGYQIEDLGGSNGSYVNGERVTSRAVLQANDVVSLGDTLLVVDEEPDPHSLPVRDDADGAAAVELIGDSFSTERLRRSVDTVAKAEGAVLLLGPTGVGKEIAAQSLHRLSERDGPLVAVNCAAIPKDLAESEFFGHDAGAFTGATHRRAGYFVEADGGTLFLDEIGDLPAQLQAKLLRVLETGEVRAVGGSGGQQVDVRIIAATHVDLEKGDFRSDLLARLTDWILVLPALVERKADVVPLWQHFLGPSLETTPELAEALLLHDWPRNVRELRKLAVRVSGTVGVGTVDLEHLPEALQAPVLARFEEPEPAALGENAPAVDALVAAIREARGNVKAAAEKHGWHRTQLYRWLRRAGIDPARYR